MPTGTEERMVRAVELIEMAVDHGLDLAAPARGRAGHPDRRRPGGGSAYLEAVRQLRARYGPDAPHHERRVNVSFGMPARRLISDVFLDLCVAAGQDSGIVDPVAADIRRALAPDREAEHYRLAADLLTGADAFGVEFIDAFRAGRLAG